MTDSRRFRAKSGPARALSLAACTAFLATGCGESARGSGVVTVDTLPSGVVQVRSSAEGLWGGESPWRVSLRARIGSVEGEGPEAFSQVMGLAEDALGRIWAMDRQAKEVRVFDADGRHVRTVGRPGGGPGEFGDPASISTGPDGGPWVLDWGINRISVFDTAGSLVAEHRRPGVGSAWTWRGGFDPEGFFVDVFLTRDRLGLVRYARGLTHLDTLFIPQSEGEPQTVAVRNERGGRAMSIPFAPQDRWVLAPGGGFWFTPDAPYRLYRLTPGLDTVRVAERPYEPVPVSGEERRRAEERVRDFFGEARVDLGRIPSEKPAVDWLAVDELGYVWVRPSLPPDAPAGALDVFDPEGRYLGPVVLPVEVTGDPIRITADRIYAVHRSQLDVPFVVILDLDRGEQVGSRAGTAVDG